MIAGVLAAAVGATNVIWIDAGSFFVAATVQSTIRSSFREPGGSSAGAERRRATTRALQFIRGERTVTTLLVSGFGNSLNVRHGDRPARPICSGGARRSSQ